MDLSSDETGKEVMCVGSGVDARRMKEQQQKNKMLKGSTKDEERRNLH